MAANTAHATDCNSHLRQRQARSARTHTQQKVAPCHLLTLQLQSTAEKARPARAKHAPVVVVQHPNPAGNRVRLRGHVRGWGAHHRRCHRRQANGGATTGPWYSLTPPTTAASHCWRGSVSCPARCAGPGKGWGLDLGRCCQRDRCGAAPPAALPTHTRPARGHWRAHATALHNECRQGLGGGQGWPCGALPCTGRPHAGLGIFAYKLPRTGHERSTTTTGLNEKPNSLGGRDRPLHRDPRALVTSHCRPSEA
jgi:hypothetical protein